MLPTSHQVKAQAAADVMAAMREARSAVAIQRLYGLGVDPTDQKLTWWTQQTMPVKVAVVGGGLLAVVGIGFGIYSMTKGRRR
jgi:hypothetical protein